MKNKIVIALRSGATVSGTVSTHEAEGWEHMLMATGEGEALDDSTFVALLETNGNLTYMRSADVLAVSFL